MTILFNIIIAPLEYFIESLFSVFYNVLGFDIFSTVLFISFFVTMLCLPLYYRADRIHDEEEAKRAELKPYIEKIKRNFKGNEQFFLLKTLYRQHDYNPVMALRNSISLLLQIPFFIAAYHFFSSQTWLSGQACGILSDLSKPDMLLNLGGFNINFLPILMTVINIISCEIYLKEDGIRPRIQPYCLAIFFLVVLYDSPSILVMYWTLNNFFYLLKNKFMDNNNPGRFAYRLSLIMLAFGLLTFIIGNLGVYEDLGRFFLKAAGLVAATVAFVFLFKYLFKKAVGLKGLFMLNGNLPAVTIFYICCLGLVILQSLIIPLNVVNTDHHAYVIELGSSNAVYEFLEKNFLVLTGLYFFWGTVVFTLLRKHHRQYLAILMFSGYLFALYNYLTIGSNVGTISYDLVFDNIKSLDILCGNVLTQVVNLILFGIMAALVWYVCKKSAGRLIVYVLVVLIISEISVAAINTKKFADGMAQIDSIEKQAASGGLTRRIQLSKTGKNVVVFFLDRFFSGYLPLLLEEKPELKSTFSGFVYYPNTVSFYARTVLGYPPCVGGYEYTPFALEKSQKPLFDKWLEASIMLPTLFNNNNYSSTVVDPMGEHDHNFCFIKDSDYEGYYSQRGLKQINLLGKYNSLIEREMFDGSLLQKGIQTTQKKFYFYSFFNIAAKFIKKLLYDNGEYLLTSKNVVKNTYSYKRSFIDAYASLYYLNSITSFDSAQNTFTLINSDLPHNAGFLQYPEYTMGKQITDRGVNRFNDEVTFMFYHTAMASLKMVGKFLDNLKENGVYDNTRVILMADHGNMYIKFPGFTASQNEIITPINPLLMFKDFGSNSEISTDKTFMTNADVPYLAVNNLIPDAKNPFTGKSLMTDYKKDGVDIYMNNWFWNPSQFKGNKAILERQPKIMHVKDDIFTESNWNSVTWNQ